MMVWKNELFLLYSHWDFFLLGIIIGATAVEHVKNNIEAAKQGPLPDSILKALDDAWKVAMFQGPPYFFWR